MSFSQHLVSGALSGFASSICLQPFDLIKTRVQQGSNDLCRKVFPFPSTPDIYLMRSRRPPGLLRVAQNVLASDGSWGLWRGTLPTLARNVPGVALYMSSLNHVRSLMTKAPFFAVHDSARKPSSSSALPVLTIQGNLLAGAFTRSAVGVLLNPFTVLKARYESDLYTYRSLWGAMKSIINSGPSTVFRGAAASAARDAPYAGIFLVGYEQIKREIALSSLTGSPPAAILVSGISGAGAGILATIITQPFDVIKTRLQVRNDNQYLNFRSTVKTILKDRGFRGFLDGVSLRLTKKVLSSAIGWAVYESLILFIYRQSSL